MAIAAELNALNATQAAKFLLGKQLVRTIGKDQLVGRIVETEAYHQNDPASHSYRGQTNRTKVMFGPPGRAYVYFTYGMHYCLNVTACPEKEGAAVLIRALEPLKGIDQMRQNRATQMAGSDPAYRSGRLNIKDIANGPAKLTQALKIGSELNGHDLNRPPLQIKAGEIIARQKIKSARRIGIAAGADKLWRFYIKGSLYVSKP